jgi:hypothetical protein
VKQSTVTYLRRRVSEKAIQAAVIKHWKVLGYPNTLVAAVPNEGAMKQPGLTKGIFDLLVIGGWIGVGFIELKREGGKLSPEQEAFKKLLIANGRHYAVCEGRDEPIRVLEAWQIVRRSAA